MTEYLVKSESLIAVADAIRTKTGKTNTLTLNDFVTEITQIDYREEIGTIPSVTGSLTYNGEEQSPTLLAYNPEQLEMTGVTSAINAGDYQIAFVPKEGYKWIDGTTTAKIVNWSIAKAAGSLSLSASSATVTGKNSDAKTFTVTRAGDGKISVSSSNTAYATASISGTTVTVTPKGYGTATITVSVAAGTNHTAPSDKTYKITINVLYLYNAGDENTSVTGGWTSAAKNIVSSGYAAGAASVSKGSTNMKFGAKVSSEGCIVYCKNKIDLTGYTTLKFQGSLEAISGSPNSGWRSLNAWSSLGTYYNSNVSARVNLHESGSVTKSVNVSSLSGGYYIGFGCYVSSKVTMTKLWLE